MVSGVADGKAREGVSCSVALVDYRSKAEEIVGQVMVAENVGDDSYVG